MLNFIATSTAEGQRMLGSPGQRSHDLLTGLVLQELGEAHAALFAEPVEAKGGAATDWYASVTGPFTPLSALEGDAELTARARLAAITDEIRAVANRLDASGAPQERRLGEALENALVTPDEDSVFFVRNGTSQNGEGENQTELWQPVLINWARRSEIGGDAVGALTGLTDRPPAPPQTPQAPPPSAAVVAPLSPVQAATPTGTGFAPWLWWLLWVILALLVSYILYLLITPCGLRALYDRGACPIATVERPIRATDDIAALEGQLRDLERQLAGVNSACATTSPPEDDFSQRLEREQGNLGKLNFTLKWDDTSDLDLIVFCPNGTRIYWRHPSPNECSGRLDVDANDIRDKQTYTRRPIENVFFADPPAGVYKAEVTRAGARTNSPARNPFSFRITFGDQTQDFSGVVDSTTSIWTKEFQYEGR